MMSGRSDKYDDTTTSDMNSLQEPLLSPPITATAPITALEVQPGNYEGKAHTPK